MHVIYVADTETTNLDPLKGDIIELSLLRLRDGEQKTFFIQPVNWENIQEEALRINGHDLQEMINGFRVEDDGTKTIYQKPEKALVEIEKFLMSDSCPSSERVLAGQNIGFDIRFLQELWARNGQKETYPFGRMYLDTMQIAFFLDYVNNVEREFGYSLSNLVKYYEVKKEKAHRAANDTRMTRDVFLKLCEASKKMTKNS